MSMSRTVIANWKMYPPTLAEAKKIFTGVKKSVATLKNVHTIICPPSVYLPELRALYGGKRISFGAQNAFSEEHGAYTGEIAPSMLASSGARYVIIGHSERRAMGEDNNQIAKKVRLALKAGLSVALCVGEKTRDNHGDYLSFVKEQLLSSCQGLVKSDLERLLIAYEPIWAIGKTSDDTVKNDELHEMTILIRKVLTERYNESTARMIPLLYGGSVKASNAQALLSGNYVSGFLVGSASLDVREFSTILSIANK